MNGNKKGYKKCTDKDVDDKYITIISKFDR